MLLITAPAPFLGRGGYKNQWSLGRDKYNNNRFLIFLHIISYSPPYPDIYGHAWNNYCWPNRTDVMQLQVLFENTSKTFSFALSLEKMGSYTFLGQLF